MAFIVAGSVEQFPLWHRRWRCPCQGMVAGPLGLVTTRRGLVTTGNVGLRHFHRWRSVERRCLRQLAGPRFGLATCLGWMAVRTTTMVSVPLAGSLKGRTIDLLCRRVIWLVVLYRSFIASFGSSYLDRLRRRGCFPLPPLGRNFGAMGLTHGVELSPIEWARGVEILCAVWRGIGDGTIQTMLPLIAYRAAPRLVRVPKAGSSHFHAVFFTRGGNVFAIGP